MRYSEKLGYSEVVQPETGTRGLKCDACGQTYWFARDGLRAVGGDILRSHRRRCPVAPASVPTPGVCDA